MAQATTDKVHHGCPMSETELAEWQKAFSDIEESIKYCEKHPCKLKKSKV